MHKVLLRLAARFPIAFTVREAANMGFSAIRAYKMRAALTILGVVMGIMTVTGMSAIVAGLNASMASQIEGFGASVIFIRPRGPGDNLSAEEARKRKGLNLDEVKAIAERCPAVSAVSPLELLRVDLIKYGDQKAQDAQILGTTNAYETVHDIYVEKGRFMSATDVNRAARVAVIGSGVAEALFPLIDPLDKYLNVDGIRFRVIGVMEKKGKFLGFDRDNLILVPMGTVQRTFLNFYIADAKPVSAGKLETAVEQIRETLRRQRKLKFLNKDTFTIFTQDTLTDLYARITGGIYMVMIAISSIGLIVGGVGVMNIMLVSVTERTREIGVRKALGAKKLDVLLQFLTEAVILTGSGGILGILIGAVVAWIVNSFSPFPALVQPVWVLIALLTSMAVGLVFGLWPAYKAARLDPIEALRYE